MPVGVFGSVRILELIADLGETLADLGETLSGAFRAFRRTIFGSGPVTETAAL